ncbi:MAG TPA: sensor histidine kinase [Streptosporangiaceae bacterium]|nr:sensor histidine kinase [Streptosporangiaceae bacterium]
MKGARGPLGIRPVDVGLALLVLGAVELNVATAGGPGAAPLNPLAYLLGAVLVLPVLVRHRWPRFELIACSVLLFIYYSTGHRRNLSPAPLLALPLYDAAVAGYLRLAIIIPAVYMVIGLFVVKLSTHQGVVSLLASFLPSIVVLFLAIVLGQEVRWRRLLAAEAAERMRMLREEQESEAARRVAEERLRIARDLHDTVAHSMATITVQAGSALHLLTGQDERVRAALTAIRQTSKAALGEMRDTLGQLRQGAVDGPAETGGLDRLPALCDAVTAAGAPVTVEVEGEQQPLPAEVDQAAYRILQESLTNVLRHAGQAARATVSLRYEPGQLVIRVTDDGGGRSGQPVPDEPGAGHGLTGMAERAAEIGGQVTAAPLAGGGFEVVAALPLADTGPASTGPASTGPASTHPASAEGAG